MSDKTHKDVAESFLRAVEAFDVVALEELLSPDAEQIELPNLLNPDGGRKTRAKMLEGLKLGQEILASQSCVINGIYPGKSGIAVEWIWRGKLAVPLGKLKPDHQISASCVAVFDITDGLITQVRNYDCYEPF